MASTPTTLSQQMHQHQQHQQQHSGLMQPPTRLMQNEALTLPKDQQEGKTNEEIFKGGSITEQLRVLGRVSQPLQEPKPTEAAYEVRGVAVAIEGDDQEAVKEVVNFLESELRNFSVRVAEGPKAPETGSDATTRAFLDLISIWYTKGEEMLQYLTKSPRRDTENDAATSPAHADSSLPILLLNRYSHFATTAWASQVPMKGLYGAKEHWLWFATLWRDAIGPDVTVYVRDVSGDEMANRKPEERVELMQDLRVIFVRNPRGVGQDRRRVEGPTLRRIGFEVTEWIRRVSGMDGNSTTMGKIAETHNPGST